MTGGSTSEFKEIDAITPNEFRAGLLDTLTAFYEKILKKAGAGGRLVVKLHQYITRKLTAWCQLYRPKPPSTESAENEDIDGEEGDIVNVPRGCALHSTSYCMSDGDEEGKEESAAPAAPAGLRNAAAPAAAAPAAAAPAAADLCAVICVLDLCAVHCNKSSMPKAA